LAVNAGHKSSQEGVNIESAGKLLSKLGQAVAEYHYQNVPRPFLYPLLGPERGDDAPLADAEPSE
jgi:hypothetical protein